MNKKGSLKINEPCPRCKRVITEDVVADMRERKISNARRSMQLAKLHGRPMGRQRIRMKPEIKTLRAQGLSQEKIGALVGLSKNSVARALKEWGIK